MITEEDLIKFGFERFDETAESSGYPNDWYYYTYELGSFSLITPSSDDVKNGEWYVELFDCDTFKFTTPEQLASLLNALKEGIKK